MEIFELFKEIRQKLIDDKLQHVQPLIRSYMKIPCIKFVSVDTDDYKNRVKKICEKYSLRLVKETVTTLVYIV